MFVKLLVGPATSGKSNYIESHKCQDDLVAFVVDDKLIFIESRRFHTSFSVSFSHTSR